MNLLGLLAEEGGIKHFEIHFVLSKPALESNRLPESNLLEFYQSLTILEVKKHPIPAHFSLHMSKAKYPTPAPSSHPVPPTSWKKKPERHLCSSQLKDIGSLRDLGPNYKAIELFSSLHTSPPRY